MGSRSCIKNGLYRGNLIWLLCSISKSVKFFDELHFERNLSDELPYLLPFNDILFSAAFTIVKENTHNSPA